MTVLAAHGKNDAGACWWKVRAPDSVASTTPSPDGPEVVDAMAVDSAPSGGGPPAEQLQTSLPVYFNCESLAEFVLVQEPLSEEERPSCNELQKVYSSLGQPHVDMEFTRFPRPTKGQISASDGDDGGYSMPIILCPLCRMQSSSGSCRCLNETCPVQFKYGYWTSQDKVIKAKSADCIGMIGMPKSVILSCNPPNVTNDDASSVVSNNSATTQGGTKKAGQSIYKGHVKTAVNALSENTRRLYLSGFPSNDWYGTDPTMVENARRLKSSSVLQDSLSPTLCVFQSFSLMSRALGLRLG